MATRSESVVQSWSPAPQAASWITDRLETFRQRSTFLQDFDTRLRKETGTRLLDWTDRIFTVSTAELSTVGFEEDAASSVWRHPDALLPAVELGVDGLAIRVESVVDFLNAQGFDDRISIVGDSGAAVRRACISDQNGVRVSVIESHGSVDWDPGNDAPLSGAVSRHLEAFRLRRRRDFADNMNALQHTERLIRAAVDELGPDRACDVFFTAERGYWQSRNQAARVQWARQAELGMGWANHDHHTYRSSRTVFSQLVRMLELLGMECRERFYAGREAGWGAQVLEQPRTRIIVFADVDLTADEVKQDFSHEPLRDRAELGTVGLWCRLHGEAFLQAGLHHLECQFDFDQAREQLATLGVPTMAPFTDLPHLKQAFTKGEIWRVDERRLAAALETGAVTSQQADEFRKSGVLGSHLEILQRDDGYKGFNQSGISDIILATDPRMQA
ncbi:MAG: hypothetical protein ABGZ23_16775 [Fuerstiella sp.]|nr:hypothetical protein [Fuerstiella sp.]